MNAIKLDKRITAVENELKRLKQSLKREPWWQTIAGSFANDSAFEEAMRLGRAYRKSQRQSPRAKK